MFGNLVEWLSGSRPYPYSRRTSAAAMGMLYLVGGVTVLLILLLPHDRAVNAPVLLVLGVVAPIVAVIVYALREDTPLAAYPWLLGIGTGIVTLLIATAGSSRATVSFSFFYMWIVLYALLFFSRLGALVQVGVAALAYLAVLAWHSSPVAGNVTATEPLVLVSVIATTSVVVAMLSRARESSETDPLTLVANRRGLERLLNTAVAGAPAAGQTLFVAMIDIDFFKKINDVQGHAAGDRILEEVSRRWRSVLRATDSLGRLGGDEFVAVLPGCSWSEAQAILERLRAATPDDVTCSVGAALWQPGDSVSMLLSNADSALYTAKRQGRDRIAWSELA